MSITVLEVERSTPRDSSADRAREAVDALAALVADLSGGIDQLSGVEAARLCVLLGEAERLAAAGKTVTAGQVAAGSRRRLVGWRR